MEHLDADVHPLRHSNPSVGVIGWFGRDLCLLVAHLLRMNERSTLHIAPADLQARLRAVCALQRVQRYRIRMLISWTPAFLTSISTPIGTTGLAAATLQELPGQV